MSTIAGILLGPWCCPALAAGAILLGAAVMAARAAGRWLREWAGIAWLLLAVRSEGDRRAPLPDWLDDALAGDDFEARAEELSSEEPAP